MPTSADVIRAKRRAIGGRRLRCRKGKSCSAACINQNKFCLVDAPTPVAGALPRAVKAIQSRKERLSPKEKRQALQKRKEYVKGKVVESAKLKRERSEFKRERNSLRVQLRRILFSGSYSDRVKLEDKLRKLEESVGSRLKVPPAPKIDTSNSGFEKASSSFRMRMESLRRKLREAAQPTTPGGRPNRQLYDELERKILAISKRDNPFWNYGNRPMKESDRGQVWKQAENNRRSNRLIRYSSVLAKLTKEASEAANRGDLKKYRSIESKLLKIADKTGSKLGVENRLTKGSLWKDVRIPMAMSSLANSIDKALDAGDLRSYSRLESKFLRLRDNYVGRDTRKSDNLWSSVGPRALARKGEMLKQRIDDLRADMKMHAYRGDRREYNKLESTLLKLSPGDKKGGMWKERVKEKVEEYLVSLGRNIDKAIRDGDKREYSKLERIYMRLNKGTRKGQMWREGRIKQYLPSLLSKMEGVAASGNRKAYDKLERVFVKLNTKVPTKESYQKGQIWLKERGNVAINKLKDEMEKAANANDRARYDKLEASFFRVRNKIGERNIRDYDMRFMSKGELWRNAMETKVLNDLGSSLNKGRGENVSNISLSGNASNFTISSNILGNRLELHINPNDSTSFTVNGSYTANPNMSRRESFAITKEAMRQYGEVVGKMEDGTVFQVSAARGDGREEMREKAYVKFGFSEPDYDGYMYGMVRGGKMVPIDEDEYRDLSR